MTLANVCVEFGIGIARNSVTHSDWAWFLGEEVGRRAEGPTPDTAVCALLKARWGITTRYNISGWWATRGTKETYFHATELAAVATLARRLKGAG